MKSGVASLAQPGLDVFTAEYKRTGPLLIGGDGVALEKFLSTPVTQWKQR
ncbi:MAG: hypothetical protein H0T48_10525 [Gemmatimonadaceae bacterium]|nr:hypothetical protein [Gemmatimonadaceae bacterium]